LTRLARPVHRPGTSDPDERFPAEHLAIAAGIGIRYDTFFGPFRIDWGFRIYNPPTPASQWITQRQLFGQTFKEGYSTSVSAMPSDSSRPRAGSLARVIGQRRVKHALLAAWRSGRLPHAYLFTGGSVGKERRALELARVLRCERGEEEAAASALLLRVASMQHPDVRLIVPLPRGAQEKDDDEPWRS